MNKCIGLPPRFGVEAFSIDLKNKLYLQYVFQNIYRIGRLRDNYLSPYYLDVYEISMNKCMGLPPRFGVEAFSTDLNNKLYLQYVFQNIYRIGRLRDNYLSPYFLDVYEISMNKCMGLPSRFGVEAFSKDFTRIRFLSSV